MNPEGNPRSMRAGNNLDRDRAMGKGSTLMESGALMD